MKNLEKFSAKVQYVTPSCKSVRIQARQTILTGSNYDDITGLRDIDDVGDGGDNDHSSNWGW